jgi:hypothetical protein
MRNYTVPLLLLIARSKTFSKQDTAAKLEVPDEVRAAVSLKSDSGFIDSSVR